MAEPPTWILTGSLENYAATAEHGFSVIGLKELRRNFALQIEPRDRIVSEHDAALLLERMGAAARPAA